MRQQNEHLAAAGLALLCIITAVMLHHAAKVRSPPFVSTKPTLGCLRAECPLPQWVRSDRMPAAKVSFPPCVSASGLMLPLARMSGIGCRWRSAEPVVDERFARGAAHVAPHLGRTFSQILFPSGFEGSEVPLVTYDITRAARATSITTSPKTQTLTAANDNPGGGTSVEVQLSSFVTIIAKAYVAAARRKEHSA